MCGCQPDQPILVQSIQILRLENQQKLKVVRHLAHQGIRHPRNRIRDNVTHHLANPILNALRQIFHLIERS